MEKTKILITGSKGMLGSALTEGLTPEFEIKGIDIEDCDITKKEDVINIIKNFSPKVVIHTAAYTDVDGSEQNSKQVFAVNAGGTENIAHAAKQIDAILFYISTDYVFNGNKDKPYVETDIPNPINIYGQSKLEGERIIQVLLEKYFILRTSWLFGPNGRNFVNTFLKKAQRNKALPVVNDQIGSPTYTLDLAKTIKPLLSILDSKPSTGFYGIYHITNSGSCSWYEFAREIISIKQLNIQILPISSRESELAACRPKMSILDNSKFFNTFKLKMRPWQEALSHFLLNYT